MKTKALLLTFFVFLISSNVFSQTENIAAQYAEAMDLLEQDRLEESFDLFKKVYPEREKTDTLKNYISWYYIGIGTELEHQNRMNQDYQKALNLAIDMQKAIQDNKDDFDEEFAEREAWMIKNIIVSYDGLNEFDEAEKYKSILYDRYRKGELPRGIDQYFNYDYFKLGDKNIWGYEWFADMPENRFSSSFTKVVYYVYSTNPDGTDKDQLYRFHVLMFHQDPKDAKFDYILERQMEIDNSTVSGSYYKYTYKMDIDYKKLRNDVIEIVTNGIETDTRRTIQRK
ncbi:MAG: hypothetical protein WBA59_05640 [Moheibacter sp.]